MHKKGKGAQAGPGGGAAAAAQIAADHAGLAPGETGMSGPGLEEPEQGPHGLRRRGRRLELFAQKVQVQGVIRPGAAGKDVQGEERMVVSAQQVQGRLAQCFERLGSAGVARLPGFCAGREPGERQAFALGGHLRRQLAATSQRLA